MFLRQTRLLLSKYLQNNSKLNLFSTSSSNIDYPGAQVIWTDKLSFTNSHSYPPISTYRVLNSKGQITNASENPNLPNDVLEKMYRDMVSLNVMDKILYESQRQGRISFYMTNFGEEAAQIGSAAALTNEDLIYGQYREAGVFMWRGFTTEEFINQCYGNFEDKGKGRQMPVHYGSKRLNFVTISSPLSTQMPQAAGAAYALKGKNKVVVCYFGEGAASEGDAHAAFNFAATLNCPVIFFCRNNGYAISTPADEQYSGDGIAGRGAGYALNTIRIDGNDVFAVYNATAKAKAFALARNKPVLIEALTYRVSHHSTSDDSTAYRSSDEVAHWANKLNPVNRLRLYLEQNNLWNEEKDNKLLKECRNKVLTVFAEAETKSKPHWTEMFTDVYKDMPDHITKQMNEMAKHIEQYKDKYPLKNFS